MTPFQHESIVLFAPRRVVERAVEHSMRVNTIHCTLEYGSEDLWQIMLLLSIEGRVIRMRTLMKACVAGVHKKINFFPKSAVSD
jgi:hypothetical protein